MCHLHEFLCKRLIKAAALELLLWANKIKEVTNYKEGFMWGQEYYLKKIWCLKYYAVDPE